MIKDGKFIEQFNKKTMAKKAAAPKLAVKTTDVLIVGKFYKRGFIKGIAGYYKKSTFIDYQIPLIESVAHFHQSLKEMEKLGGTSVRLKVIQDAVIDYPEFHIDRLLPFELRELTAEQQLKDLVDSIQQYFVLEHQFEAASIVSPLKDKAAELWDQKHNLRTAIALKITELNSPEKS
jgi:hypothetical protein